MPTTETWEVIQKFRQDVHPPTPESIAANEGHFEGGIHVPKNCVLDLGKVYLIH